MTDQADRLQPEASLGAEALTRPTSPVSAATGFVGIGATALLPTVFIGSDVSVNAQALILPVVLIALMAMWSVLVERVHLIPATGLDLSSPRPLSGTDGERVHQEIVAKPENLADGRGATELAAAAVLARSELAQKRNAAEIELVFLRVSTGSRLHLDAANDGEEFTA